MIIPEDDYFQHYGTPRKSGRYPWGSGKDSYQSNKDFVAYVDGLRKKGLSEVEIARGIGEDYTTTQLRNDKANAKAAIKAADVARAQRLRSEGKSLTAIGKDMGLNESSIRALLKPGEDKKAEIVTSIANQIKGEIETKKYVDVGKGVEHHMRVGRTKLDQAISRLKDEGYTIHYVPVVQIGTGLKTSMKVLAAPGTTYSEVARNKSEIKQIVGSSDDGGLSFFGIEKPMSISSKRVAVRYKEDGGTDADGVIYVRPGVKDTSLGKSRYAQVRIAVDGTHYLKGMAIYKDDLPDGVDLLFNTNKSNTGNKLDAMKELKKDAKSGEVDDANPFGATVRQIGDPLPGGRKKLTSVMNIVNDEGDWEEWSKSLSSQMLSKQPPALAKGQLELTLAKKKAEFEEIKRATNPEVKKKLLASFADDADSSAVHLKAAHLPRQSSRVILPVNSLKPTEIYAPDFRNGERVVLIRYPHGGIFEIPELTVNNRHPQAQKLIGPAAKDAVGINSKVAERLSGADFDGDTVLVIPNPHGQIKTAPALAGLKGFDPQAAYPKYDGMPVMSPRTKQIEMGKVSNLITDMTIKGAPADELARAVRHSMVVIDAEKHKLNYRQSAKDNGIAQLKAKYQGSPTGGAKTLISNSGTTSTIRIPKRREARVSEGGPIDRATGARRFVNTGESYVNEHGKKIDRTEEVPRLSYVKDAHIYSSGKPIEKLYADHSNALKDLANQARLEALKTKSIPYSSTANTAYAREVQTLKSKLALAQKNAPLERQAQIIANATYDQKKHDNPDMDTSEQKKVKFQALEEARNRVGAKKERIEITPREWDAIQAGAITKGMLNNILVNTDLDKVKQFATPKTRPSLGSSQMSRARAMLSKGYTRAEVADALGVSVSTLQNSLKSEGEEDNG